MRKRLIIILATVLVSILLFSSCGGEKNKNSSLTDVRENYTSSKTVKSSKEGKGGSISERYFKYNENDIVSAVSSLGLQSGKKMLTFSTDQSKKIIKQLNSLNLIASEDPYSDPLTAPIGGDIILKIGENSAEIYIVGDDVIKINDCYYKDSDGKIRDIAKEVTDLLYLFQQSK